MSTKDRIVEVNVSQGSVDDIEDALADCRRRAGEGKMATLRVKASNGAEMVICYADDFDPLKMKGRS